MRSTGRVFDSLISTNIGYNPELKKMYKVEGMKFLKAIAKEIGNIIGVSNVKLTYNPGGIAVAGDLAMWITLGYGKMVNIQLSADSIKGIMFRRVRSYEDYTGFHNFWLYYDKMRQMTYREIAQYIVNAMAID